MERLLEYKKVTDGKKVLNESDMKIIKDWTSDDGQNSYEKLIELNGTIIKFFIFGKGNWYITNNLSNFQNLLNQGQVAKKELPYAKRFIDEKIIPDEKKMLKYAAFKSK